MRFISGCAYMYFCTPDIWMSQDDGGGDLSPDGHFIFDGSDVLTVTDNDSNVNGVRPALWLSDL